MIKLVIYYLPTPWLAYNEQVLSTTIENKLFTSRAYVNIEEAKQDFNYLIEQEKQVFRRNPYLKDGRISRLELYDNNWNLVKMWERRKKLVFIKK